MSRRRLGIVNFYCYCFGNINLKSIRGKGRGVQGEQNHKFPQVKSSSDKVLF